MADTTTPTQSTLEVSLALSGGAVRGSFHLGFIQALQESNVAIKAISGSSAGAIVGGAIACGLKPKKILKILQSKEFKKVFAPNWFQTSLLTIDTKNSVFSQLFPRDDLSQTDIPFYACVVDINTNEAFFRNSGDGQTLILASSSLIPFFAPVEFEGRTLVDGGFLELLPTTPLLTLPYPILSINLHPHFSITKKSSFKKVTQKAFDFLITSNAKKDEKNSTWYISPNELKDIRMHSLKDLQKGYDLGYKFGQKWCKITL